MRISISDICVSVSPPELGPNELNMVDCVPFDIWDHVYSVQAMTGAHPGATSWTHPTEKQAMEGPRAHVYRAAMQKEIAQCNEQEVWDLVETTSPKRDEVPLPCSMD